MTHLKTAKNFQLNIAMKKFGMDTFRTNTEIRILKHKRKVQKTINKGDIILGQVADSLIKIKHNKDMTAGGEKNAVMPLIQMCKDGLTFLAHCNNLVNQTHRNYITSFSPRPMSELGKKVPEDSDWLFGDNIVFRINQIKAKQQALKLVSDIFHQIRIPHQMIVLQKL